MKHLLEVVPWEVFCKAPPKISLIPWILSFQAPPEVLPKDVS